MGSSGNLESSGKFIVNGYIHSVRKDMRCEIHRYRMVMKITFMGRGVYVQRVQGALIVS